jgi:hypothetical protein
MARIADLVDYAFTRARLAALDWLAPMLRTPADEVHEREREQLRRALPGLLPEDLPRRPGFSRGFSIIRRASGQGRRPPHSLTK